MVPSWHHVIKFPDFLRDLTTNFRFEGKHWWDLPIDLSIKYDVKYDVNMTSNYVMVSIKFAYMLEVLCNFGGRITSGFWLKMALAPPTHRLQDAKKLGLNKVKQG